MKGTHLYTFIRKSDGLAFHYDIGKFNALLYAQPTWFVRSEGALTQSLVTHFMRECGVEQVRLDSLTALQAVAPGLGVILGDGVTVELIDGHHRAVWLYQHGGRSFRAYALPEVVALEHCQADLTTEEKRRAERIARDQVPVRKLLAEKFR